MDRALAVSCICVGRNTPQATTAERSWYRPDLDRDYLANLSPDHDHAPRRPMARPEGSRPPVKIKKLAASALLPAAAAAGLTLSTGAAAHAAPAPHAQADRAATAWVTARQDDSLARLGAPYHYSWQVMWATPANYLHVRNVNSVPAGERIRVPSNPLLRAEQFKALWRREAIETREATARAEAARAAAAHQAAAAAAQAEAARSAASSQAQSQPAASGPSVTAGESSFEQCVAWRESGDTPTDPDGLFGILPSVWQSLGYSGTAGQASVAQQQAAFNRLYAEYGSQPWAPSDGC
jgi:hypothetical protein